MMERRFCWSEGEVMVSGYVGQGRVVDAGVIGDVGERWRGRCSLRKLECHVDLG